VWPRVKINIEIGEESRNLSAWRRQHRNQYLVQRAAALSLSLAFIRALFFVYLVVCDYIEKVISCVARRAPQFGPFCFLLLARNFSTTSNGACWNILNRERNKNKSCRERDNLKTFLCKTRAIHKHTQSLSWELYINSTYYSWILNFSFLIVVDTSHIIYCESPQNFNFASLYFIIFSTKLGDFF